MYVNVFSCYGAGCFLGVAGLNLSEDTHFVNAFGKIEDFFTLKKDNIVGILNLIRGYIISEK